MRKRESEKERRGPSQTEMVLRVQMHSRREKKEKNEISRITTNVKKAQKMRWCACDPRRGRSRERKYKNKWGWLIACTMYQAGEGAYRSASCVMRDTSSRRR